MKNFFSFFLILFSGFVFSQEGLIQLTEDKIGSSFTENVYVLEDAEHSLEIIDVLELSNDDFFIPNHAHPNLDFTSSRFWIKFSIENQTDESYFILETARPITNKVIFYEMNGPLVENEYMSGDDFHYSEKVIPHRKNLFPFTIEPGETKDYYLELESDGEVLTLPVIIHDKIGFFDGDSRNHFSFGFYYGLMSLVIIIYFFFFIMLKDRSFLYYILYVFAQALLQFSLDGFSYHHFFPSGGYLANHFVLIIASVTIVLLLTYVRQFLNLKERNKLLNKVFVICKSVVFVALIMSLIPGKLYELSYPIINGVSLLSIILTVVAIFRLKYKKIEVDNYFTLAFTILITGAVIFILGNFNIVGDSSISQVALKVSSAIEVAILSISMSNKYRKLQKDKEAAQAVALKSLEEQNALKDSINIKLEQQVKERTFEIEEQKEKLAEINNEILSSIHYAKRIQEAILPSDAHVKNLLPKSFIFYRPKDVVSGDFYFVEPTRTSNDEVDLVLFAAVDCTGHGVPGAFMSIVGNNYLTQTITEESVNSTAEALDYLNQGVCKSLRQDAKFNETTVRDGMDISLCAFDKKKRLLHFSGAKNPVYVVRKGSEEKELGFELDAEGKNPLKMEGANIYLNEIKGDAHPIGAYVGNELKAFTNNSIELLEGDMVYVFSDGFADQFGGPSGKKYKYKTFKKFLLSISQFEPEKQRDMLIAEFDKWKGDNEQLDDVLVIGVRVE